MLKLKMYTKRRFIYAILIIAANVLASNSSWATTQLPNSESREMPGANIQKTMVFQNRAENLTQSQQAIDDLQKGDLKPTDYDIRYNGSDYISEIKFSDGTSLVFNYILDKTNKVSGVNISQNGKHVLSIEADNGMLKAMAKQQAGEKNNFTSLDLPDKVLDPIIEDAERGRNEPPRLRRRVDPETFEKFLSSFKKPSKASERFSGFGGTNKVVEPEMDFGHLKMIFTELQNEQKKALEAYLRETNGLGATLKITAEEIESPQEIHEVPNPVKQVSRGTTEKNLRTAEFNAVSTISGSSPREILRASLGKSLTRFNSKIEKILPGQTVIKIMNGVTEIIITLPATN